MTPTDEEGGQYICGTVHNFFALISEIVDQNADHIALFLALLFQVRVDSLVAAEEFLQYLRLPGVPHGLFVIMHFHMIFDVFPPAVPSGIDAFGT